eukprot:CAMPEP_0206404228 /NCGR_PEP_ID=MMETSP0294-20121207/28229_1 /ASSEMBLY_ACC=CAM_ASM_000327 /TAXON_ID=39354 /ORGANISM="Heterosigma akashiwo, Strain CCMP2393" /LENGTH=193 /DNA_ID=CAMNT_0053862057 /DNA_START=23 /DNA_END=601 /DNA_ORIENTATION=-
MSLKNNEPPVSSIVCKLMEDTKNLNLHYLNLKDSKAFENSFRSPHNQYEFLKHKLKAKELEAEWHRKVKQENKSLVTRLARHAGRDEFTRRLFVEDKFKEGHPGTVNTALRRREAQTIDMENKALARRLAERGSSSEYSQVTCRPKFFRPKHLFAEKNRSMLPRMHAKRMAQLGVSTRFTATGTISNESPAPG